MKKKNITIIGLLVIILILIIVTIVLAIKLGKKADCNCDCTSKTTWQTQLYTAPSPSDDYKGEAITKAHDVNYTIN